MNRTKTIFKLRGQFLSISLFNCSVNENKAQNPTIVIIYTNDQGYGDVSALNPDEKFKTPNIDRIVNDGVTYTDGHSSDAICTPSRYILLTGRYSWRGLA